MLDWLSALQKLMAVNERMDSIEREITRLGLNVEKVVDRVNTLEREVAALRESGEKNVQTVRADVANFRAEIAEFVAQLKTASQLQRQIESSED